MSVQVQNPHLESLKVDYLYHLMIDSESTKLEEKFGDTKFVIMGGSEGRMAEFAAALYNDLKGIFAFFAVVLSKNYCPSKRQLCECCHPVKMMRIHHIIWSILKLFFRLA